MQQRLMATMYGLCPFLLKPYTDSIAASTAFIQRHGQRGQESPVIDGVLDVLFGLAASVFR